MAGKDPAAPRFQRLELKAVDQATMLRKPRKEKKTGECRLCGRFGKLCDSHIFSEFLYGPIYDETGHFIAASTNPRHQPRLMQKGIWGNLLCEECERRFNVHATYAADVLRKADSLFGEHGESVELEVDFHSFRQFGMSLLWRAHHSPQHMFAG
ncbi:MAG TPA: hypothetical protein VEY33_07825 [Gemmatimonadota bacterium]|nr:hypothetical protein [Gemmatimonadota bacterium]